MPLLSSIQSPQAPDYDSHHQRRSALMKKKDSRRKFEPRDASDLAYVNGGPAPPASPSQSLRGRSHSTPPPIAGSSRILSAVEKKAR